MPGLTGFVKEIEYSKAENRILLDKMISTMKYRDEFLVNVYADEKAGLGRVSLGVLNADPQPIWSDDKRYCLFMDGQIFDYEEAQNSLKGEGYKFVNNSEEEIVLNLFLKMGLRMVDHLKGIFLILIYDTRENVLYLISDRYGLVYLYYYIDARQFIFSSELKAILAVDGINRDINEAAICDFHRFHFITGDQSFFKQIRLLPYGSILVKNKNGLKIKRYWDYPKNINYRRENIDELVDEGAYHLRTAVERQFKKPLKIGITLSGGLDSRILSGFASQIRNGINCFHIGDSHWQETKIAKRIAEAIGMTWNLYDGINIDFINMVKEGSFIGDGQFSCEQYWMLGLLRWIRERKDVNLIVHGLGTDVLFQAPFLIVNNERKYNKEKIIHNITGRYSFIWPQLAGEIFTKEFITKLQRLPDENVVSCIEKFNGGNPTEQSQFFYFSNRGRRYVHGTCFANRKYAEIAYPGMDYDVFDFGTSLPINYRDKSPLYRKIILKVFPELGVIPSAATGLPLDKYETSFSPIKKRLKKYLYYLERLSNGRVQLLLPRWYFNRRFRKDKKFRQDIVEILYDPRTYSRGFFDRTGIERLVQLQLSGRNYFMLFNSILSVEFFYRIFIDE